MQNNEIFTLKLVEYRCTILPDRYSFSYRRVLGSSLLHKISFLKEINNFPSEKKIAKTIKSRRGFGRKE